MSALYRIRPLRWNVNARNDYCQSWWAETFAGDYVIERIRNSPERKWGEWSLRKSFHRQPFQEREAPVKSLAAGKRLAQSDWESRVRTALIEHEDREQGAFFRSRARFDVP